MKKKENGKRTFSIDTVSLLIAAVAFVSLLVALLAFIPFKNSPPRDEDASRRVEKPPPTPVSPYPGTVLGRDGYLRTEVVVVNKFAGEGFAAVADPGGGKSLLVLCKKGTYSPNIKEGDSIRIRGQVLEELFVGNSIILILDEVGLVKDLVE